MKHLVRSLLILVVAIGGPLACGPAGASPTAKPSAYVIDFANGQDEADGLSIATAWRRAPGDPLATGEAARTKLGPGDTLKFVSGVRYHGQVSLNGSGDKDRPITLTSTDPARPAIFDGSDPEPAPPRPCRSAAECGDVEGWQRLSRVEFSSPLPPSATLFAGEALLYPAQYPNAPDIFYSDDIVHYLDVAGKDLSLGSAHLPKEVAAALSSPGERRVALWVYGNQVVERNILAVDGATALFDPKDLTFYPDRPSKIAVAGHPKLIDRAGEYAVLEGRRAAVVWLPPGANTVSVAHGRGGINLNGQSHIVVRNLAFENMADDGKDGRSGIAIGNRALGGTDIAIRDNRFRSFRMPLGQGPIILRNVERLAISGNDIEGVALGSGMRLSRASEVEITRNRIRRIGRTGIMLMDVRNGLIAENTVIDAKGVHGNGISAYLANRNLRFLANSVTEATRPMTFHGAREGAEPNELLLANNLFIATPDSSAAVSSWGDTRNVRIRNNVMLGGKIGLLLSQQDRDVDVSNNIANGVSTRGPPPADWRIESNEEVAFEAVADRKGHHGPGWLKSVLGGAGADGRPSEKLCKLLARGQPEEATAGFRKSVGAEARCEGP